MGFLTPRNTADGYYKCNVVTFSVVIFSSGVRYFFSGHLHYNAETSYKDSEIITTSAIGAQLGSDESGFRIVKVSQDGVKHVYVRFEDVSNSDLL